MTEFIVKNDWAIDIYSYVSDRCTYLVTVYDDGETESQYVNYSLSECLHIATTYEGLELVNIK